MKKVLLAIWALFFLVFTKGQSCFSDEMLQQQIAANPALAFQREAIERFTQQWLLENDTRLSEKAVITIPVVVHIVWKTSEENLSDAQIQSQIEALNRDFRMKNTETRAVPAIFKPVLADVEIEFCLAQTSPDGNFTNGITRTQTSISMIGIKFNEGRRTICYTELGGQDAWDTRYYLNIWVGKSAPIFIGEASFPGMSVPAEDGIRIDPAYFGTININPPYDLGRTLTHEVGHYFNLNHPWGSKSENTDCMEDDQVADTPKQAFTYRGECPAHPQISCGTADMFMNFMNYTDDACMAMFTLGQKARMLAALNGPRATLLQSTNCDMPVSIREPQVPIPFRLLENPARDHIYLQFNADFQEFVQLKIFNINGVSLLQDSFFANGTYQRSINQLNSGIYFVILKTKTNIFHKKLIISP